MFLKDILCLLREKVCIYTIDIEKDGDEAFVDLYKGKASDIPLCLYKMQVLKVYAKRKGVLDILVEKE